MCKYSVMCESLNGRTPGITYCGPCKQSPHIQFQLLQYVPYDIYFSPEIRPFSYLVLLYLSYAF